MIPSLRSGVTLALLCVCGVDARASDDPLPAHARVERVSDSELAQQRGGFVWQGLDIRFGADVSSYSGDELVMRTVVSWTDTGVSSLSSVPDGIAPVAAATELRSALASADGLSSVLGNVVLGNQGRTAFIQRADGTIQNIIVNTASNVDLRQQIEARLNIGGFEPFSADVLAARVAASMAGMRALGATR